MSQLPNHQESSKAGQVNRAEGDVDRLVNERFFANENQGVFVDVGAARPDYLSVSNLFRTKGWKVLAVEPNPGYSDHYERLGIERLPYACGDHDEDDVDFVVVNSHDAEYRDGNVTYESWSSLAIKDTYSELKSDLDTTKIKVNLRRLDTIIKAHAPDADQVDMISLDIEGWELEALSGLDFDQYKPRVLVVENLFYESSYRKFMKERGYALWRCLPPNDIYVRAEMLSKGEALMSRCRTSVVTAIGRCRVLVGRVLRKLK